MAYGQTQVVTAYPQPGTSNLPFAVKVRVSGGFLGLFPKYKWLPPFIPVNYTNTSDISLAIDTLTLLEIVPNFLSMMAVLGTPPKPAPGTILQALESEAVSLAKIEENLAKISLSLQSSIVEVDALTTQLVAADSLLKSKLSNQIKNDNFWKAVNGEKTELKPFTEQLKDSVKDALAFNDAVRTGNIVNNFISSTVNTAGKMIAATEIYKSATTVVKKLLVDVSAILPDSVRTKLVKTQVVNPV